MSSTNRIGSRCFFAYESFENMDQARASVFKYIGMFYNRKRFHQSLEYLSPEQFEQKHAQALAA